MLNLNHIQNFLAVVEAGNFAAAGRKLGLSRAQVSKSVSALEDRLSVQLFHRTTRSVNLSTSGAALYERMRYIVAEINETERMIKGADPMPKGTLRIGAPLTFGKQHIGPALHDFMALYPDVRVELSLNDYFVDPLATGLDAVIRIGDPLLDSGLIDHPILSMKGYVAASPEFVRKHGPIETLDQLKEIPCLYYGDDLRNPKWVLDGPTGQVKAQIYSRYCCNNGETLLSGAVEGYGLVALPTFIIGPALQSGKLQRVLCDYAMPERQLMLLYPPSRHPSAMIKALIDFMYDRFADLPY